MVTDILYIKHVLLDAFQTISVAFLHSQEEEEDEDEEEEDNNNNNYYNFKVMCSWPKQHLSILYYEYHACSST